MRSNQSHYKKSRREGALERLKKQLSDPNSPKKDYYKEQIRILEEKLKSV